MRHGRHHHGNGEFTDLAHMKAGEKAVVVSIKGGHWLHVKTESQGIRIGVEIEKLTSSFMSGPVTIRIGNTTIALGYRIARKIIVTRIADK